MAEIRFKLAKYIGIVALQYVVAAIILGDFWLFYSTGTMSFEAAIVMMLTMSILLLVIVELAARRLFP